MAFTFQIKRKLTDTQPGSNNLAEAEFGLMMTGTGNQGSRLFLGMGATNTPKEITFVGHTHGLADIVSGVTAGALVYGSSSGSFINLAIGNANDILKVVGTAPVWAAPSNLTLQFTTSNTVGKDLYVHNVNTPQVVQFLSGTNVTLATGTGTVTFSSPSLSYVETGTGNVVTGLIVSNHQISASLGITALTEESQTLQDVTALGQSSNQSLTLSNAIPLNFTNTSPTIRFNNTGARTVELFSDITSTGNTKTINLGRNGAAGSTTVLNLGTNNSGVTTVNIGSNVTNGVTTIESPLTVVRNLTVNGTMTTINSTTVTIDDPVFTLAGDTANQVAGTSNRGIEYKYSNVNWTSLITSGCINVASPGQTATITITNIGTSSAVGDWITIEGIPAGPGASLNGTWKITVVGGANTVTFVTTAPSADSGTYTPTAVYTARNGFFGHRLTDNTFVYIPRTTNTVDDGIFSGTLGAAAFGATSVASLASTGAISGTSITGTSLTVGTGSITGGTLSLTSSNTGTIASITGNSIVAGDVLNISSTTNASRTTGKLLNVVSSGTLGSVNTDLRHVAFVMTNTNNGTNAKNTALFVSASGATGTGSKNIAIQVNSGELNMGGQAIDNGSIDCGTW